MSQVGESARSRVRVGQCVAAIGAVGVPVFLWILLCSNETSVARIRIAYCQVTPGIMDDLCCVPYVATSDGWAEVDTWPLTPGVCCHLTEMRGAYDL